MSFNFNSFYNNGDSIALFSKKEMRYLVIILVFTVLYSCKKKEIEEPMPPPVSSTTAYTIKDYFPLKYGNYWVYEFTRTDTNNVVQVTFIDSCFVRDSTFHNGRWFYMLNDHFSKAYYFTDSADCIIRTNGSIELKLSNDTIEKASYANSVDSCTWTHVMNTTPTTFSFNNKNYYNCISHICYFKSNMNPYCNDWIIYDTYSPGVGMVYSKYGYINSCDILELKLLRYKIN